ncbi:GlcG/HbpS family heme-binding protein [Niallia endozanthoxylica]|uniref:Heme-binding protein n=1 Tax=Niallia endozanthoxylica TaxID=2036016 RepID=A0A5J5HW61_9BACI|nr:heme-binding protein [Niallia endozanthoxylica]KAA9027023.1 heme-binding protein [Niallia endozanthoxylica]
MKSSYQKPILPQILTFEMLKAACKKAEELKIKVTVAICDDGGNLKSFTRMDGASLLSLEISQNKAYTSASGRATEDWYPTIKNNPALLHGIVHTNRLAIFGGGLPIYLNGVLVGGVGVSGGTAEEDVECAKAAISVIEKVLEEEGIIYS